MKDNRTSMQLIKDAAKRLKACELKNIADFETNHVLDLLLKKLGLKNQRQVILLVSIFENSFKNFTGHSLYGYQMLRFLPFSDPFNIKNCL